MKLLYIHQHFITNEGTGGTRSFDVSRHMVAMGHEVTMVCGDCWQSNWDPLPRWKLFEIRHIEGIKVIRCNVRYSNKMGAYTRVFSFFHFAFMATLVGLFERGVDVVFATSTPLTVGIPGRLVSTLRRLPFVFEVRDMWPEDFVAGGYMKRGSLKWRLFDILERFSYQTAARILTVSRGFTDFLWERGYKQALTIHLGAEGALFLDIEPDREFLRGLGLEGKIVAVYAGSFGIENGLDCVLEAADDLREHPEISFLLMGDGMMKPVWSALAKEMDLPNVVFCDPIPKERLFPILLGCDIGLLILRDQGRIRQVTPNKYFDTAFLGLPAIVNYAGTTADLLKEHGIGLLAPAGNNPALARRVKELASDKKLRRIMGEKARQVAFEQYDRPIIAAQMVEVFEAVIKEHR